MCERVVVQLPLGDVEITAVGILITLVCVKLMKRLLLILLRPTTVGGVRATIDT